MYVYRIYRMWAALSVTVTTDGSIRMLFIQTSKQGHGAHHRPKKIVDKRGLHFTI